MNSSESVETKTFRFEIGESVNGEEHTPYIISAISQAEIEISSLDETIASVKNLKPQCDAIDYSLAAASGTLCGLIDIFLVGKPGESPLGNIFDGRFTCNNDILNGTVYRRI